MDLLSGTGHKIYGPKGTGFLFVREGTPLLPLLHGGGQERAPPRVPKTSPGAVGLARRFDSAVDELPEQEPRAWLVLLRDRLAQAAVRRAESEDVRVNGADGRARAARAERGVRRGQTTAAPS